MSWLADHQVLLAGLVLILLVLLGLAVLAVRGVVLYRASRRGMRRAQGPVRRITNGLELAERRVDALSREQAKLTEAVDAVAAHTGELRILVAHASRALAVIRAPLRYLGR